MQKWGSQNKGLSSKSAPGLLLLPFKGLIMTREVKFGVQFLGKTEQDVNCLLTFECWSEPTSQGQTRPRSSRLHKWLGVK